jgi:hypothetical protein
MISNHASVIESQCEDAHILGMGYYTCDPFPILNHLQTVIPGRHKGSPCGIYLDSPRSTRLARYCSFYGIPGKEQRKKEK